MNILENKDVKIVKSEHYNSFFNKLNGFFARWGTTKEDDPQMAPLPEILDLEISQGKCSGKCPECYKCNGDVEETYNMDFYTFRKILHKIAYTAVRIKFKYRPTIYEWLIDNINSVYYDCYTKQDIINRNLEYYKDEVEEIKVYNCGCLTQIAFGICDLDTNPDFIRMMKYCREFDIIPNFTFNGNGLTEQLADEISKVAGAVAISVYNKNKAYDCVKMLTDRGMKQINFHCITHDKSYEKILSIIDDISTDERLKKLNALVLLRYKPKGNGVGKFKQLTIEQYKHIIYYAKEKNVNIGFDSCSAPLYLQAIKGDKELEKTEIFVEPCESSLFSSYINCKGEFYACSFCEGEGMWKTGINVLNKDFSSVWHNEQTKKFRDILLKNNRHCPMFKLEEKHEN